MRIGVYTIALNEAKFADRWAKSVRDADYVMVADTGSTDDTASILMSHGVTVHSISIKPWRFDDARNAAQALLPADLDVLVPLDMDEILLPGWRANVERTFTGNRLRYGFVWNEDIKFLSDKITGRHTHRWTRPVHEVLTPTVPEVWSVCQDILIEQHADPNKSRGQYLDLLRLAVTEDPDDDRSCHYYGRELFFHRHYEPAIDELRRHLALPRATWAAERAASMRYIAKSYEALNDAKNAHKWFLQATFEDESSRESLIDAAKFCLAQNAFYATIDLCERALALPPTIDTYMAERYANNEGPYDLAAVAYYHIGQRQRAIALATEAVTRNPNDTRLHNNLSMMDAPRAS